MRQRTTWKANTRSASTQRRADIYTMNQDHPQPSVTDYESGDPDAWAETPAKSTSVEKEYQGGAVKRDGIGFAEFRDDTWNHAGTRPWGKGGSYDNTKLAAVQRKAVACERVARAILRTDNDKLIEDVATDLMHLPNRALASTLKRMDKVSPAALSDNARYRRALACTKLSAVILGEESDDHTIERLATVFNGLDDPTLKSILHIVASRVAAGDDEPESKEEKEEEEEKGEKGKKKEPEKSGDKTGAKEKDASLSKDDLEKLETMIKDAVGDIMPAAAPAAAPAAGVDDLQALFGEPAPAAPAIAPVPPPAEQPAGFEISFDDDEEPAPGPAPAPVPGLPAVASDLEGLFDTDENLAQREIRAAAGFPNGRTAATKGAKKLGQVQATKSSQDDELAAIWERP